MLIPKGYTVTIFQICPQFSWGKWHEVPKVVLNSFIKRLLQYRFCSPAPPAIFSNSGGASYFYYNDSKQNYSSTYRISQFFAPFTDFLRLVEPVFFQ